VQEFFEKGWAGKNLFLKNKLTEPKIKDKKSTFGV